MPCRFICVYWTPLQLMFSIFHQICRNFSSDKTMNLFYGNSWTNVSLPVLRVVLECYHIKTIGFHIVKRDEGRQVFNRSFSRVCIKRNFYDIVRSVAFIRRCMFCSRRFFGFISKIEKNIIQCTTVLENCFHGVLGWIICLKVEYGLKTGRSFSNLWKMSM